MLQNAFNIQFNKDLWERFLQFPKEKRALVIDNYGQSNLNQQSLQKLLEIACKYFELVVVFAHDNLRLQQHLQNENGEIKFSDYSHCKLLPLDATQRTQLIRRWVRLENDSSSEESDLVRQENHLRGLIQTAVNSGVVASTPFFILGILQLIESYESNPNAQFGSIGYIYQGIVTKKLSELNKTPPQINQTFLLTSLLAHWLYKNDVNEISEEDFQGVITQYNKNYRENIYLANFIKDLQTAQIVIRLGNNNWSFVGSHLRDFFVAKYYAQAIGEDDSVEQNTAITDIKLMIETILYEPHTRILLFLVYEANSNKKLIRWILTEASRIYANFDISNFESDTEFINDLEQSILDGNLLESENPLKNQDKRDESTTDDENDELSITENSLNKHLVKYSDELDDFTKASISLKMIELVGQLVKSFAGTIKAELKHQLIEECINIGLRFLRSIFDLHKDNLNELSNILKYLIRQRHPNISESELENRRDELLILIHHGLAYGVIKKISLSVGHEDLKDSFTDVFQSNELTSYKLVETAIRLDHYNSPMADKLIKLGKGIENNKFAFKVLRRLIADYVNYFEVMGAERQKLVEAFQLSGGKEYLLNNNKSERDAHLNHRQPQRFSPPQK